MTKLQNQILLLHQFEDIASLKVQMRVVKVISQFIAAGSGHKKEIYSARVMAAIITPGHDIISLLFAHYSRHVSSLSLCARALFGCSSSTHPPYTLEPVSSIAKKSKCYLRCTLHRGDACCRLLSL
jgi:hypothetical protein